MTMKRTSGYLKKLGLCRFIIVILILLFSLSSSLIFQAKGSSEPLEDDNPVTLFEISGEMKVTFQICSDDESSSPSKNDFQLGEAVYLRLAVDFYHGGDVPLIASNTIFVVSDADGTVIWNISMNEFGGGWFAPIDDDGPAIACGMSTVVHWTPERTGTYVAGVVFEETIYPNNFSKIMSFRVLGPCSLVGKVTEIDSVTPIEGAIVEALGGNEVMAHATTGNEGRFSIEFEMAETYDVRVSALGYITTVCKGLFTRLEETVLDVSLAPVNLSPTFNTIWTNAVGDTYDAVLDSEGNIFTTGGMETTIICKFDSNGNIVWNISRQFSSQWEVPRGITVDSSNNILILVDCQELVDSQETEYDFCIVKLDPSGNKIWVNTFDSGENDFGNEITVDSQDNIVVVGNIYGSSHRDGGLVLVKYNSNGNIVWSKALTGFFRINRIITDKEDSVVLCGTTFANQTDMDYYVAKIDINGNLLWQRTFSSDDRNTDNGCGAALDSSGNIIVTGDSFMVKLDPNGSKLWLRHFTGNDVLVDSNGRIVVIDGSSVEVFDPTGVFVGQTTFNDDLQILVFDLEGNLIIVGYKSMANLSYKVPEASSNANSAKNDTIETDVPVVISASSIAVIACVSSLLYYMKRQKSCDY
jgi:hypothetical protein